MDAEERGGCVAAWACPRSPIPPPSAVQDTQLSLPLPTSAAALLGGGDAGASGAAAVTAAAVQAAGGADLFGGNDAMFDDLRLTSLIAEGGTSRVWRGEWKTSRVAVKVLSHGGPTSSPEALRSFVQETRILRELRHPSICSFLGACMQQGLPAIVLECLPGGSLYSLLHEAPAARSGADGGSSPPAAASAPLVPALLSRLSLEVAQGVAYLHQSQVIHRDIKSANVLLDAQQHAKVTDFGISTRLAPTLTLALTYTLALTLTLTLTLTWTRHPADEVHPSGWCTH